jgi:hypothetical protein
MGPLWAFPGFRLRRIKASKNIWRAVIQGQRTLQIAGAGKLPLRYVALQTIDEATGSYFAVPTAGFDIFGFM